MAEYVLLVSGGHNLERHFTPDVAGPFASVEAAAEATTEIERSGLYTCEVRLLHDYNEFIARKL